MTLALACWRLIAYDIRQPARLQRVHRQLSREAWFVQESLAASYLTNDALASLVKRTTALLKPADDLRVYNVGDITATRWLGRGVPDALRCNFHSTTLLPEWLIRSSALQHAEADSDDE